jgi:hypothetical protein
MNIHIYYIFKAVSHITNRNYLPSLTIESPSSPTHHDQVHGKNMLADLLDVSMEVHKVSPNPSRQSLYMELEP